MPPVKAASVFSGGSPTILKYYNPFPCFRGASIEFVSFDEVNDWQISELSLACFEHPLSKDGIREEIEVDERVPDWGGRLFAIENNNVLGTAGLIYPKAKTKYGIEKVGGIKSVCSRPSASRRGIASKLIEKLHERLREKDVKYSILNTSRGLVAHNLYQKLGYRDFHRIPMAYKKTGEGNPKVRFERTEAPQFIKSLYEKSVEGLYGLTVREKFYWDLADARGFPDNENIYIAHESGERIGYALFKNERGHMLCEEIGARKRTDLPKILEALEHKTHEEFIVIKWVNPNYQDIFEDFGFRYYDDRWDCTMINNLEGPTEEALETFNYGNDAHIGVYEYY